MSSCSRTIVLWLMVLFCACSSADDTKSGSDAIKVGVMVPFTGRAATAGVNLERAMMLAAEQINSSDGVMERRFVLDVKDTGTNFEDAKDIADELTSQKNVVALIGPDQAAVAINLRSSVVASDTVCLLPSTYGPDVSSLYFADRYFLLAPSITPLTEAVYDRLKSDGIENPAILNDLDTNNIKMGRDLITHSEVDGLNYADAITLNPDSNSFGNVISELDDRHPDAIVLFTFPLMAAELINELAVSGHGSERRVRWYLGPLLRSDLLVTNIVPGAIDGAIGVSVGCESGGNDFEAFFAERWNGDTPLFGAPFYYDAIILTALGLEAWAAQNGESLPSGDDLYEHIQAAANPPGKEVSWNDVDLALSLVRRGEAVNYRGICSTLDFDDRGVAGDPMVEYWRVKDNKIVD